MRQLLVAPIKLGIIREKKGSCTQDESQELVYRPTHLDLQIPAAGDSMINRQCRNRPRPLAAQCRNVHEGSTSSGFGFRLRSRQRLKRDLVDSFGAGSLNSGSENGGKSNIFLQA
jgi:hypothetical protein